MTPLTERPLAASPLWAAKQPSREHIVERACVSSRPLLVTHTNARTHTHARSLSSPLAASLEQAGEDKRRSEQAIFPAPLGDEERRFSGPRRLAPVAGRHETGGRRT